MNYYGFIKPNTYNIVIITLVLLGWYIIFKYKKNSYLYILNDIRLIKIELF